MLIDIYFMLTAQAQSQFHKNTPLSIDLENIKAFDDTDVIDSSIDTIAILFASLKTTIAII